MSAWARWTALAGVVLVGLGIGWIALFGSRHEPGGLGVTQTGPMSVWPEDPFGPADALREAQDRSNAGQEGWRRSPTAVVARFARNVFGWDRVEFDEHGDGRGHGPQTFSVRADCASEGICAATDPRWVGVAVDQLGLQRNAGVWSVVAVSSARLPLPVAAGHAVAAGEVLSFRLHLDAGEHAAVGIRFVQRLGGPTRIECPDTFEGRTDVTDPLQELTVPDPLFARGACAGFGAVGYVFAYITPTLTVQTGDPLLESASITDLSIVPVLFSASATSGPGPATSP